MIQKVTGEWAEKYEEYVKKSPRGHFVKSLKWAEFKKPHAVEAFLSLDDLGHIKGSMLIFISRVPKTRLTHMYCPRGPVADGDDAMTLRELVCEAERLAKEYNACELAIDPDITGDDTEYLHLLKSVGFNMDNTKNRPEYLQARYVYRLSLAGKSEDEIFAAFHQKTRYNVRVAMKHGVQCVIGDKSDLPEFCAVMNETAKRDGFIGRGLQYFEEMYDVLAPRHLRLYLMKYEGEVVAGAVSILYGDKVWYLYGASSNKQRNKMPNYLMQWEMIKWAREEGCTLYDFRGITGDMEKSVLSGLIRFKAGFGAVQADFVGKMSIQYKPKTARFIENAQSIYRSIIRFVRVKR